MAAESFGRILPWTILFLSLPRLCHQQACPSLELLTCIDVNDCYYESSAQLNLADAVYACSCNALTLAEPPTQHMFRLEASPDVIHTRFYWLNAAGNVTDLQHYIISNAVSAYTEGGIDQLCVYYNATKRVPDRKMCRDKLPFICRTGGVMSAKAFGNSWYKSRNLCLEEGGDLAYLYNGEPMSLVDSAAQDRSMWIGSTMQKWRWRNTGQDIMYTFWAEDQPLGRDYLCMQWVVGKGWVSVLCDNTRARPLCYGPYRQITERPTPVVTPAATPPPFRPTPTPAVTPPPLRPTPTPPITPPPFRPQTPPVTPPFTPPVTPPVTPPPFRPQTPPITLPVTPPFGPGPAVTTPTAPFPPVAVSTEMSTRAVLTPVPTLPSTVPTKPITPAPPSALPTKPFRTPAPQGTSFPTLPVTRYRQTTPTLRPSRDPNAIDPQPLNTFSDPSMRNKLIAGIVAGVVGLLFLLILIVAITAWRRQKKHSEYGQHIEESSEEGSPSTNTYSGTINNGAMLPPIVEDVEPAYSTLGRTDNNDMAESAQVSSDPSYSFYGMHDTSKSDAVYAQSNKARGRPHHSGFAY